jgi:Tol biopolymer transport system component
MCTAGNSSTQRICLTDRNGADLGHVPNSGSSTQWEWSPDGRWIVLPHWDNGSYGVAVLRADGAEHKLLLNRKVRSFFGVKPLWLPDGSRIVFSLEPPDNKEDPCTTTPPCPDDAGIWSMRVDGSDLRPVTTGTNDELEDLRGG